jgi:ribonuclease HI
MPLAEDLASELATVEARLVAALLAAEVTNSAPRPSPATKREEETVTDADSAKLQAPTPPEENRQSEAVSSRTDDGIASTEATPASAVVYTDGSAEGNPGPGGYGAIVRVPGLPDRELSGGTNHTTNNKMELTAAIVGVSAALDVGARQVTVISDSEYLVKGMTRWLAGWQAKGWKTATGEPVKNREYWERLAALAKRGEVRWQWIRGHAGHPENERCDVLATNAARKAAGRSNASLT